MVKMQSFSYENKENNQELEYYCLSYKQTSSLAREEGGMVKGYNGKEKRVIL